jgi:hypothetical protein
MGHSINLMAICNADRVFTYLFVGFPGSAHDSRVRKIYFNMIHNKVIVILKVFHNSNLVHNIEVNGANEYFRDVGRYHIIGDSAFPLRDWLMKSYRNAKLTPMQRKHNFILSSARVVIENIFGIVKGRWARLQFINTYNVSEATEIVTAACILHNFCLLHSDQWTGEVIQDNRHIEEEGDLREQNTAQQKRNRIAMELMEL